MNIILIFRVKKKRIKKRRLKNKKKMIYNLINKGFDLNVLFLNKILNDAPEPWQIGFQDSAAPGFTGIVELHNTLFFYIVIICISVFWILGTITYTYSYNKNPIAHKYLNHGTLIELIWTIVPALVLIAIAFPSFRLLYLLDEVISPTITIKVTGHQWYWSFEYSDYVTESGDPIEFDSYMIPESDLELGQFRLLDVDNRVVVPVDTHIRLIVTGADVIHDYAIPSLGLKIDACPGRLNQVSLLTERTGVFYGQCSEICGVYHGFMPTAIEAVSVENYLSFLDSL
uniref:cytochrome c oxidase subunit 2 n=1 Tax=Fuscoporia gilva TaxID=40471 RepID=UPI0023D873F2|nr:cytochrome c oxidase subunit 2 [Fuscoporia gilva]WDD39642.1 cytochrome c oxidase subunit 2 [Fuscoporia gilva]